MASGTGPPCWLLPSSPARSCAAVQCAVKQGMVWVKLQAPPADGSGGRPARCACWAYFLPSGRQPFPALHATGEVAAAPLLDASCAPSIHVPSHQNDLSSIQSPTPAASASFLSSRRRAGLPLATCGGTSLVSWAELGSGGVGSKGVGLRWVAWLYRTSALLPRHAGLARFLHISNRKPVPCPPHPPACPCNPSPSA